MGQMDDIDQEEQRRFHQGDSARERRKADEIAKQAKDQLKKERNAAAKWAYDEWRQKFHLSCLQQSILIEKEQKRRIDKVLGHESAFTNWPNALAHASVRVIGLGIVIYGGCQLDMHVFISGLCLFGLGEICYYLSDIRACLRHLVERSNKDTED